MKVTRATPIADVQAIAIVGASCRLPGAADLTAFAELLARGADAVGEIPAGRWSQKLFGHPDPASVGKSYTFAAGCLAQIDRFDPGFFGIAPREAAQMDPQQRLLLELTLEALEDAGMPPSSIAGSRTSVHIGGSSSDYVTLRLGDPSGADAYFMTGSTLCSLSNRVSHAFDLRGPSFTVDSACSSSLVALHLACEALRRGEADIALCGGVNLLLAPQSFVGFSRAGMLSPSGRCRAFDADADGYVRAEGGGMLVLKPLLAALADDDAIHAVIRATAVNSDGHTAGFSLPSEAAQAELLRQVYDRAGLRAEDLVYLEAHGTGTKVGDPIEAAAIGEVLGSRRSRALPIGSVKTHIGHLEAASGIAGVMKLLVGFGARAVAPSLHLRTPNPAIPFAALNLCLAREDVAVPAGGQATMGINSFGFGGTNAHAVLQAPPSPEPAQDRPAPPMLLLSARCEAALIDLAAAWRRILTEAPPAEVPALLRGAARGREVYAHRLVVLGDGPAALTAAIDRHAAGRATAAAVTGVAPRGGEKLAFAFAGNGSQWAGMAGDALTHSRVFGGALDEVDALLTPLLGWSVRATLERPDAAGLRRIDVAQPLLFAIQVGCVAALRAAGVVAQAHVGHSAGEVAAAWASGALSLAQAARVIAVRSRYQQSRHGIGRMAVLGLGEAAARSAIGELHGLTVAAINSRSAVTVAGPEASLTALATLAAARGWSLLPLDLDYAFHSPAMDPIREGILQELAGLAPREAHTLFVSSVTGAAAEGVTLDGGYWWRNVRAPVRFADAAAAVVAQGVRLFVEIGPQPVLQSFLRDAMEAGAPGTGGRSLPGLTRRPVAGDPFLQAAARAHVAGHDISAGPLFDGPLRCRELPHYPWQRERYWFDRTTEATDLLGAASVHPLLGFARAGVDGAWFSHVDLRTQPWLAGHVVDGAVLLPAAAMIDIALAACAERHPQAAVLELWDLEIVRKLALEAGQTLELGCTVDEHGGVRLTARPRLSAEPAVCHAFGRVAAGEPGCLLAGPEMSGAGEELQAAAFYARAATLGLAYGPAFRTVRSITLTGSRTARVAFEGPVDGQACGSVIDPAMLDGALQGLAVLAMRERPAHGGAVSVVPVRFGRVRLLARGAVPAAAELHVTQAGPRSVCADIVLRDADGGTVAELLECWCVALGGASETAAVPALRTIWVPSLLAETGPPVALVADEAAPVASVGEPQMLADACLAGAALAAVQGIDGEVGGRLAAPRALLDVLLGWLEQDGLAARRGTQMRLVAQSGLPPPAMLFGSLLFDAPAHGAEAALLAAFIAGLPGRLRGEPAEALPAALMDQMLHDGPSAEAMLDALTSAFAQRIAAWPAGRRLRVLELNAGRGALSRRLLPLLAERPDCAYFAMTADPDAAPSLRAVLGGRPGAAVVLAGSAEAEAGALRDFDLAVGLHALTMQAGTAELLAVALRRDGFALLAEPAPNRLWQALMTGGLACAGGLRAPARWVAVLEDAGFGDIAEAPVGADFWPGWRVEARCLCAPHPDRGAEPPSMVVCHLEQPGCHGWPRVPADMVTCAEAELATLLAGGMDDTLVLLLPHPEPGAMVAATAMLLARLAALAEPLAQGAGADLVLAVRARPRGDPFAAALQGFARVMMNETGAARCRLWRFDPALPHDRVAELIRQERAEVDGEAEVAWTLAGRFVPRLRQDPPSDRPAGPVALTVGRTGMLGSLAWRRLALPGPGPGELEIEVGAAGLNFRDVMWVLGLLPDEALLRGFAGATLGLEFAGVVRAVGEGVHGFAPGARVMGLAPAALASRVITAAHAVMPVPEGMSETEAATLPVACMTVAYGLGHLAQLGAGERVLIHGAAGGVGLAAIQYARARGAEIFATAGSAAKRAMLRLLGVEHVLNSRGVAFADDVLRLTGGSGVDVVLNCLSGVAMERSLGLLAPFGRFVELGKRDLYGNTGVGLRPLRHNASYFAVDADQLAAARPALAGRLLGEIGGLLTAGALRPLPYRRFDFADAEGAFRLMQAAGHVGKIVLTPGARPPAGEPAPGFVARSEGAYVLTGALSGFGRATALWLVEQGARLLAVLSRRGPGDPAAAELVAACAKAGARLLVLACDVADEAALAAGLHRVRAELGPIVGVLHCAMVLDDALLPRQDAARMQAVLAPKLGGALGLDRLTRGDPIELFLMFGSIVTSLGNPGQAGYVAANAALEAIAERRHGEGLPALTVAWGPIGDVGVLARDAGASELLARRIGATHMTAARALAALPGLLASGQPVLTCAEIPWSAARASLPALAGRFAEDLMSAPAPEPAAEDFRATLAALPPDQAGARVAALLIEQVAEILRLAPSRIDPDTPLADLGMDSLMAVELRIAVERRFGLSLPLLSLSSGLTPAAMAARLMRSLMEPASAEPAAGEAGVAALVARHEIAAGEVLAGAAVAAEP